MPYNSVLSGWERHRSQRAIGAQGRSGLSIHMHLPTRGSDFAADQNASGGAIDPITLFGSSRYLYRDLRRAAGGSAGHISF